jgi:group I intron endonuclease
MKTITPLPGTISSTVYRSIGGTMNQGIYTITHDKSGKLYVGSSVNIKRRFNRHRNELRKNIHRCAHLQRAWNKYGEEAFVFRIVDLVPDVEKLLLKEQFWIDTTFKTKLYNTCPKAGSPLGMRLTEEQRKKISIAHKGKPKSAEHCAAMKEGAKTRVRTEEELDAWRFNRLGKKNGPEHVEKARARWLETVGSKTKEEMEAWGQKSRRRCSLEGIEYKSVKEACELTGLYKQKLKAQSTFRYL